MRIEVMLSLFFPDCCRTPWGNGRTHDQLHISWKQKTEDIFLLNRDSVNDGVLYKI